MANSILAADMKGVMFVAGYRGKGKTFLAAHSDFPSNIAFFDFDEGKGEGLHNQLNFGYYKPVEENEPLKRADMFLSEVSNMPQDKFTVVIIDNISPLEKALQAAVYRDAQKYADIYGYTKASVLKDEYGKARGIVNDLIGDAIAKPLHAKGIKLIIVTSHVKEKYNVPGKMNIQGRDRWQDLSILTLILVEGDSYPIPSAIVQKEALGNIVISDDFTDDQIQAIMRGEVASHIINRRLPARLPHADWQSIRRYLYKSANLENPMQGEKLVLSESEPFSEKMSKEQVSYQLGILEREKKEEERAKVAELMIRQSQEKAIKEYINTNFNGAPNPVKLNGIKAAIEAGKLIYNDELTLAKVSDWS
jgi:hypothetical protein